MGRSSPAIHGGAYFSAVCGWKSIPISAPEAHEHRECCGLLALTLTITFFVFHSLPCPLGAQGKFSRGFVPKGPIWICHHSNFGFLLYFLSDRIIETNNKGGNVAHETMVIWLFLKVFSQHDQDRFFISVILHLFYISCLIMFILWTHTQCFLPFLSLTYLFAHCLFVSIETGQSLITNLL